MEPPADRRHRLIEMLALLFKLARVGPLKGKNRLFFIAHGKQCAHRLMAVLAGEKLIGQSTNKPPLRRAGILRFIDQNMLQPAIDFEQHPLRRAMPAQQPIGRGNQIVIIQHGARRFGGCIIIHQSGGKSQQRGGQIISAARAQTQGDVFHSFAQLINQARLGRHLFGYFFGRQGFTQPPLGQENRLQQHPMRRLIIILRGFFDGRQPIAQGVSACLIGFAAALKPGRQGLGMRADMRARFGH